MESAEPGSLVELVGSAELAELGTTGNTILSIGVARRIRIAPLLTALVAQRAEIRWRIVRRGRGSRSAGRAAICPALAPVAGVWGIAVVALGEEAVWAAARESAGEAQAAASEAEATALETGAFLPAAAAEVRSVADRPASADRARGQAVRVALRALEAVEAAAVVGVVAVEGAGNRVSRVRGAM